MRAAGAAAMMLVAAGCSPQAGSASAADPDSLIECAVGGAAAYARECSVERVRQDGAEVWLVRHPDGGFRRFEVLDGGAGFATADGADAAEVSPGPGGLEVAVGADRYRFPAEASANDPE
ncbi:MAG TPA: hypothetical protein VK000_00900 [Luteimonas sp.]|nr:hypothetical protein [Luteimonas sp.]